MLPEPRRFPSLFPGPWLLPLKPIPSPKRASSCKTPPTFTGLLSLCRGSRTSYPSSTFCKQPTCHRVSDPFPHHFQASHHRLSQKCQRRTFKDRVSVGPFTSPIRCLSWIPSPYPPERRQPCLPSWCLQTEDPKPVAGHSFPGLVPSPPVPSEDLSCSRLEFPQSTPALGCAVPKQLWDWSVRGCAKPLDLKATRRRTAHLSFSRRRGGLPPAPSPRL